jgi:acyl-CoA hydrolase
MKPIAINEGGFQFTENGNSATGTDSFLSFNQANREVLRITHDGRMIIGEGLSTEEATQEAAKLLIVSFEEQIQKMVDARLAADTVRMDWLEKESPEDWGIWSIDRATIDKAMKEGIK